MRTRDSRSNSGPPTSTGARSRRLRRPAVSAEWVTQQILAPGALRFVDEEGRGIVLSAVETGAAPANLLTSGRKTYSSTLRFRISK